ncbi:MAG: hypothetical protein H6555_04100 [Lewinellaceae bacterium]|nr:hypothetical protein [Lewinellaceae bacterium]
MRLIVLLLFLLSGYASCAQKIEVEKRLPLSQLEDTLRQWINQYYPQTGILRLYLEQSETGVFHEVKFRAAKHRYSIKFALPIGGLVDVEKTIKPREIPSAVYHQLQQSLDQTLKQWRLVKIQEQYPHPTGKLQRYELELKGIYEGAAGLFEVHFTPSGALESIRQVLQRPNDLLFF